MVNALARAQIVLGHLPAFADAGCEVNRFVVAFLVLDDQHRIAEVCVGSNLNREAGRGCSSCPARAEGSGLVGFVALSCVFHAAFPFATSVGVAQLAHTFSPPGVVRSASRFWQRWHLAKGSVSCGQGLGFCCLFFIAPPLITLQGQKAKSILLINGEDPTLSDGRSAKAA
jgi:hypothetical protein